MKELRVNEIVINPVKNNISGFLHELLEEEPETRTVQYIIERDMDTEEKGHTKQVEYSDDPEAIVILSGAYHKYKLSEIE